MGRPVYTSELSDPDFSWLINNFKERHPGYVCLEQSCLPIVLFKDRSSGAGPAEEAEEAPRIEEHEVKPAVRPG